MDKYGDNDANIDNINPFLESTVLAIGSQRQTQPSLGGVNRMRPKITSRL